MTDNVVPLLACALVNALVETLCFRLWIKMIDEYSMGCKQRRGVVADLLIFLGVEWLMFNAVRDRQDMLTLLSCL